MALGTSILADEDALLGEILLGNVGFESFEAVSRGRHTARNSFIAEDRGRHSLAILPIEVENRGRHSAFLPLEAESRGRHKVIFQTFDASSRGRSNVYKALAAESRGRASVLNAQEAASRGRHNVFLAVAADDRGRHRVFFTFSVADRGRHHVYLAAEVDDRGRHRVEELTIERFELYRGIDTAPDFAAAPLATFATLPSPPIVLGTPVSGTELHRLVLRRRNRFGVLAEIIFERLVEVGVGGIEILIPPSDPKDSEIEPAIGGLVTVESFYEYADDQTIADQWAIYVRDDGTAPDPVLDTPTLIDQTVPRINWREELDDTIGPFADGATVKVIIRARRKSDGAESTNLNVLTTTADSDGGGAPQQTGAFLGREKKQAQ